APGAQEGQKNARAREGRRTAGQDGYSPAVRPLGTYRALARRGGSGGPRATPGHRRSPETTLLGSAQRSHDPAGPQAGSRSTGHRPPKPSNISPQHETFSSARR